MVLTPLYLALDPVYGVECMRGKGLEKKNEEAEAKLKEQGEDVLGLKIALVWQWADVLGGGSLGREELVRLVEHVGYDVLLTLRLLPKPIEEGSHVRWNGMAGTVCYLNRDNETIQIRWDGGKVSHTIPMHALDFEIPSDFSIDETAFRSDCCSSDKAKERVGEWFKKLRLPLAKPEPGCLDDDCLACGF